MPQPKRMLREDLFDTHQLNKTGSRKCVGLLVRFCWVIWKFFLKLLKYFKTLSKKIPDPALWWAELVFQGEKPCGKEVQWFRKRDFWPQTERAAVQEGRGETRTEEMSPGVCAGHCLHSGELMLTLSSSFSTEKHPKHEGCSVFLPFHQDLSKP